MPTLRVRLFGELEVATEDHSFAGPVARKAQELFCYLLLYRERVHTRETLARLLWEDSASGSARTYLRKTLWQLHSALTATGHAALLEATTDHVQLRAGASLWLDIAVLEQAGRLAHTYAGRPLDSGAAAVVAEAVGLYQGDLLSAWDQEWCRVERARLQTLYLTLLKQLMTYYESQRQYPAGIACGEQVLRWQPGCEETHQQLMHLRCRAGDRSGALRQYAQCVAVLAAEFRATPTGATTRLYDQIRTNQESASGATAPAPPPDGLVLPTVLGRLRQLEAVVADLQQQIQQEIHRVEAVLGPPVVPPTPPILAERFEIHKENAPGYAPTTH